MLGFSRHWAFTCVFLLFWLQILYLQSFPDKLLLHFKGKALSVQCINSAGAGTGTLMCPLGLYKAPGNRQKSDLAEIAPPTNLLHRRVRFKSLKTLLFLSCLAELRLLRGSHTDLEMAPGAEQPLSSLPPSSLGQTVLLRVMVDY